MCVCVCVYTHFKQNYLLLALFNLLYDTLFTVSNVDLLKCMPKL